VLEGAGHFLQFERPPEVSQLLVEWMGADAQSITTDSR
jgi:pimeloyl-ACP methyl ester carboxylesterase